MDDGVVLDALRAGLREVPGARAALCALRAEGVAVALSSGFAPGVRDALAAALGWEDMIDLVLSPAEVGGYGLPDPAMPLAAARRFDVGPGEMVMAGDATADIVAARRAGAGLAIGVRSGAHHEPALRAAGADAVIDSVADLPALLIAESGAAGAGQPSSELAELRWGGAAGRTTRMSAGPKVAPRPIRWPATAKLPGRPGKAVCG
ncbi:HAD family hydrolase [Pseudonocardia artemisiae]